MNNTYDNNNAFSRTSRIGKVCIEQKIYYQIQIVVLFDLNEGKVIENALLLSYVLFIPYFHTKYNV